MLLARLGIGRITCIDPGIFRLSNVNRQNFSSCISIRKKKALIVAQKVKEINPYIEVSCLPVRLTEKNAYKLISGHEIILEAVDNLFSKIIIHRTAKVLGIPSMAILGSPPHRGFVSIFTPSGPSYEEVMSLPIYSDLRSYRSKEFQKLEIRLRQQRAKGALKNGARVEWVDQFCVGQAGWPTDVIRVHLVALLAVYEAVQWVLHGKAMSRAPKAIIVNLAHPQMVTIQAPRNRRRWSYAEL